MKKITVTIIISLVMCLGMAFPASALTYDSSGHSQANTNLTAIKNYKASLTPSIIPASYQYYAVFSNYAFNIIYAVYSSTPTINVGSTIYVLQYTSGANGDGKPHTVKELSFNGTDIKLVRSDNLAWTFDDHYLSNLSTATFYNLESLDASYNIKLSTVLPSLTSLQTLINTAKAKQNIGYTTATWQALQNAITTAQSYITKTKFTQSELDNAKNALQSAINSLELILNTSELLTLISQAETITDIGYTSQSWTSFTSALSSAISLFESGEYTQAEIDSASSALSAAMSGLTLNVVTPPTPPALGFDLGSGDISGFLAPALPLFSGYVLSIMPVVISFFSIYFGIKLLPYVFKRIMNAFRR